MPFRASRNSENCSRTSENQKALLIRPRALYALEPHLDFSGPAVASLCDLGVALSALKDNPPHIYYGFRLNLVVSDSIRADASRKKYGFCDMDAQAAPSQMYRPDCAGMKRNPYELWAISSEQPPQGSWPMAQSQSALLFPQQITPDAVIRVL